LTIEHPQSARQTFRDSLLLPTFKHAFANVPAYSRKFAAVRNLPKSIAEISKAPLLNKLEMINNIVDFRDANLPTQLVQHTSGTTGNTLIIHRGASEAEFIRAFFQEVLTSAAEADSKGSSFRVPLCVNLKANFHGEPTPMPYPGDVFSFDVRDSFWDVKTIFQDPKSIVGKESDSIVLAGLESQLRILTCKLIEADFDFSKSKVRSLHTTGDIITERLRTWYENTWKCPLIDCYSMTEVIGGANRCSECGYRHFDPQVVGEIIDLKNLEPISTGVGELVVTCLFPFVQKQPIIRYRTGDLAEQGPTTCPVDSFAFNLKGRAGQCAFDIDIGEDQRRPLLFAIDVYDVLDSFPEVASSVMFKNIPGITDHSALGHLKFRLAIQKHRGKSHLEVQVELRFVPYLYPERANSLREAIWTALLLRHPALQTEVHSGNVDLHVLLLPPNALASSFLPDEVDQ
jgi:phenylacetate-coenzyme A ligase PaaK-like adenylate-forming protein